MSAFLIFTFALSVPKRKPSGIMTAARPVAFKRYIITDINRSAVSLLLRSVGKFILTPYGERTLENQSPGLDKRLVGIPDAIRALTIGLASARVTFTRLLEIVICLIP